MDFKKSSPIGCELVCPATLRLASAGQGPMAILLPAPSISIAHSLHTTGRTFSQRSTLTHSTADVRGVHISQQSLPGHLPGIVNPEVHSAQLLLGKVPKLCKAAALQCTRVVPHFLSETSLPACDQLARLAGTTTCKPHIRQNSDIRDPTHINMAQ